MRRRGLSQAAYGLAGYIKQSAKTKRYPAEVYSVTDRETTGFVVCNVFFRDPASDGRVTVYARDNLELASGCWVWISPTGPQGNYEIVGFVESGGSGEGSAGAVIPPIMAPVVTAPANTDLVIRAPSGQKTTVGRDGDETELVGTISGLVCDSVTRTVGSGKDHGTLQAAADWFKNKLLVGSCKIDLDAGAYDEEILFEDIFIAKGGALTVEGDTRALAGLTYVSGNYTATAWQAATAYVVGNQVQSTTPGFYWYECTTAGTSGAGEPTWGTTIGGTTNDNTVVWTCHGVLANQAGLTNGGSGACMLANNGNDIYVASASAYPDFDADGWGNGDEVLVFDNTGTTAKYTIDSIGIGVSKHILRLTAAAPNVGNAGTAVMLIPNVKIDRSTAGRCITVDGVRGVKFKGIYVETSTGSDCDGLYIEGTGSVVLENFAAYVEDIGIYAFRNHCRIDSTNGALSVWGAGKNAAYFVSGCSSGILQYAIAVDCSTNGFHATDFAYINCRYAIVSGSSGNGYRAMRFSNVFARDCTALNAVTGYYAADGSMLYAYATDNLNDGNTTDYNPAPGAIPGYGNGNGNADLYASA